jgi:hypothetical protein
MDGFTVLGRRRGGHEMTLCVICRKQEAGYGICQGCVMTGDALDEVNRLRAALAQYADRRNWSQNASIWLPLKTRGYEIAEEALK